MQNTGLRMAWQIARCRETLKMTYTKSQFVPLIAFDIEEL